jgi:hypothetical protein
MVCEALADGSYLPRGSSAPRGFDTQRHWSEKAIRRSAPALLALFSVVTFFARQHMTKSLRQ